MGVKEYRTQKKEGWGAGPWQNEPDKVQWVDEASGLDCLIVRGPVGALCGYVGVSEGHPFFGRGYDQCADGPACPHYKTHEARKQEALDHANEAETEHEKEMWLNLAKIEESRARRDAEWDVDGHCEWDCPNRIESILNVHGGVTFGGFCHEPLSFEEWVVKCQDPDQQKHWAYHGCPEGATYQEYVEWHEGTSICHLAEPGRPDKVWWIGFDCSHSMDVSPRMRELMGRPSLLDEGVYRDLFYVRNEVEELAKQVASYGENPLDVLEI